MFNVKRAYEPATKGDGVRVLVDRLWPRGRSKADLKIDHWLKDVAPSPSLRKWFNHDPEKWKEFRERYARELNDNREAVEPLLDLRAKTVTLVFAARDTEHNNAVALAGYLEKAARGKRARK